MFRVTAFPAVEGDCFLIEYGCVDRPVRVLIDGGRSSTFHDHLRGALGAIAEADRRLSLLVITHIDRDHIEGILELAEDRSLPLAVDDVWFNGYAHLDGGFLPVLGAAHGERLSAAIRGREWPWNKAFGGGPVSLDEAGRPLDKPLPLGATIKLLSPSRKKLAALKPKWKKECKRLGLIPGGLAGLAVPPRQRLPVLRPRTGDDLAAIAGHKTDPDEAEPNGSSIAFLFEYDGRRVLFGADAHPDVLLESIGQIAGGKRLLVDLFKVPHHGSRANVTLPLCDAIDFGDALISTNGKMFGHPDEEAVARIIVSSKQDLKLHFNYRNDITASWTAVDTGAHRKLRLCLPNQAQDGFCVIDLQANSSNLR